MQATEKVTVRLIVAVDGALRALDQFDTKMTDAANASARAGAGVDAFQKQLARQRQAIEAGIPVMKARAAVMQAEERALASVYGKADAVAKARIAAERDLSRAAAAASNLVAQGKISEADAIRQLMQIENAHAAAVDRAVANAGKLAAANQNVADSYQRRGGSVNSANIAFQLQDVAVTSQMGMSPLMIGLQQGSQLSQSFAGQGFKQSIMGVGAALASLASPISIATVGLTALTAAGIQWAISLSGKTDDATTALERHAEMLDKLLSGYGDLRNIADRAAESMLKLPEGVVASDLQASLKAQEDTLANIGQRADDLREKFMRAVQIASVSPTIGRDAANQLQALSELQLSAASSKEQLDAAATAARNLYNTADDPLIREWADDFYQLSNELRNVLAVTGSLDAALRALPRDIQIRVSMQNAFSDAMGSMGDLYMDPRSPYERARSDLKIQADAAVANAQSYSQAAGAAAEYQRVLESINAAEAKAAERATGRGVGGGGGSKANPYDRWGDTVAQFQQRLEQQQLEIALMGQSTYAIEQQRAAFELLNQAKQAGLTINPQLTDQINGLTAAYAQSSVELERLQQQQREIDQINGLLADGFKDLFKGLITGTKSANDAIADLLGKLGDLFLDRAFNMLFSGFGMGGGIGGGKGGLLGGFIIPGILHEGGVAGAHGYSHGKSYSPSVWANATRYHTGGIAGLKPDEVPAILQRGERVIPRNAANDNTTGGTINVVVSADVDNSGNIIPLVRSVSGQVAGQMVKPVYDAMERSSGRYQ